MVINFLTVLGGIIILISISAAFSGLKMVIHNFMDYGYFHRLWLKYTIFYTFAFGLRVAFSQLINSSFAYTWPILLLIVVSEVLLFYKKYYLLGTKKKYFIFLLSSTVFGTMIITVVFSSLLVMFFLLIS